MCEVFPMTNKEGAVTDKETEAMSSWIAPWGTYHHSITATCHTNTLLSPLLGILYNHPQIIIVKYIKSCLKDKCKMSLFLIICWVFKVKNICEIWAALHSNSSVWHYPAFPHFQSMKWRYPIELCSSFSDWRRYESATWDQEENADMTFHLWSSFTNISIYLIACEAAVYPRKLIVLERLWFF